MYENKKSGGDSMKSTMTTEKIIEQTEKQIVALEIWNKDNSYNPCLKTIKQVQKNIKTIHKLSKFLWSFNRKMFENEGLSDK